MKIRSFQCASQKFILFAALAFHFANHGLAQEQSSAGTSANAGMKTQLEWFRNARFGLFIHWDMSSVAGTEISWSRKGSKPLDITGDQAGYVEDTLYDNLYKKFNPQQFDATAWVDLAKKAGMKYLVFTAKHHGGFCMWDTRYTTYNIMNTPFHRDVVKELADACHKAGMGFGLYYSQRDWHHPDYGIGDNRKYIDYMNGQITELLTRYGKVDILWWDSYGRGDLENFWHIDETYRLVKKLQPEILMNNRMAVLGDYNAQPASYLGDWDTPEQRLGEFQNKRLWESCMSLVEAKDGGWSYRPDGKLHSYEDCINTLVSCATGDGNLLLDAGPDATGKIPADQTDRLLQMGAWLKTYGASIYGTRGGPYKNGDWGGSTYRDSTIYLHIRKWEGVRIKLPLLKQEVISYSDLSKKENHSRIKKGRAAMVIYLARKWQHSPDTVIELKLNGNASRELVNNEPIAVDRTAK